MIDERIGAMLAASAGTAVVYGALNVPRLQRGLLYLRAAALLVGEMYQGGKARLSRWPECVHRAREY